VIVGAKRPDQLEDNIAATRLKLTPEDLAALDDVSALPTEYPQWMFDRQSANRIPGEK
jgi:aryl-alcohol dehydrogenase-like predicted oxidoreductase